MSTRGLKKWALLLTFWVALHTARLQGQTISGNTVDGNFTVTGNSDLQGNTLTLGTNSVTTDWGVSALYTDGATSTLEFDASRSANIWKWQQNGSTTLQVQMSLNNSNNLVIYSTGSSPTAKITLNPGGTSTFASSLTVNGTDNEMPNQTLVNGNSLLTEGLADSRYLSNGSSLTIGPGSTATGTNSVAFGNSTTASGDFSFANGSGSTASGLCSTAMGLNSTASGYCSTALGGANASGFGSTAMGNSTASGNYSTASGYFAKAQACYSFVVGSWNVGGGSPSIWTATDPLFEVGNGNGGTASNYYQQVKSDALVVYKNGNTAIQGTLTTGGVITAQPGGDIPTYTGN